MMERICVQAPAKMNWGLDITGKRADGYHLLRSLMQSVSLYDTLYLEKSAQDDCVCTPQLKVDGENIVLKVWRLMKEHYGLPGGLHVHINKQIPEGGGLAGGTTDAAAAMLGINTLFGLDLPREEMLALGLKIGADMPFCLTGGLAMVEGIGETITPLQPQVSYPVVLIHPGVAVSTPAVYKAFDPSQIMADSQMHLLQEALLHGDYDGICRYARNSLEAPAFSLCPEIEAIKQRAAAHSICVLMSGSGSCVWALCKDLPQAAALVRDLEGAYPFVRLVHTVFHGPVCTVWE